MSPEEMVEDDLIRNGQESLMRALTTLDSRLVAFAANPFVGAGGCVPGRAFLCVHPSFWENIDTTAKQLAEECDSFAGFSGSSCCLQLSQGCRHRFNEGRKLRTQLGNPPACLIAFRRERCWPGFLARELVR